jgi:hypothetical protein
MRLVRYAACTPYITVKQTRGKLVSSAEHVVRFESSIARHLTFNVRSLKSQKRQKRYSTGVRVELTILRLTVARLNQLGHPVVM